MIVTVANHVDSYRVKAKYAKDVHQLDGRNGRRELTEFINNKIVDTLDIHPSQTIVDIGCGDGTLLTMLKQRESVQVCGLTGSEEEAERLRACGLDARQGFTDALPLPDHAADVVVCNGVLLLVPRDRIPTSLREIARVAKPGAQIYLGEIPCEPEHAGVPRPKNVSSMLWYLLTTHGFRTFAGMCRRIVWRGIRGEPTILNAAPVVEFYAEPTEFIRMASDCGMNLKQQFPCDGLEQFGVRVTRSRMNYLFTTAA